MLGTIPAPIVGVPQIDQAIQLSYICSGFRSVQCRPLVVGSDSVSHLGFAVSMDFLVVFLTPLAPTIPPPSLQ